MATRKRSRKRSVPSSKKVGRSVKERELKAMLAFWRKPANVEFLRLAVEDLGLLIRLLK
jgi:hypothetical protein